VPYFDQKVYFGKTPVAGFVLEATATDLASPVEGLTEYRSDTKIARIYLNGAWVRLDAGGSSALGHTHASSEIVSGTIDLARLGTTPAGGDFLKAIGVSGAADWVSPAQVKTDLVLVKGDVGLGNVPNVDTTNASNITSGTLPTAVLPPLAINEVFTASSQAAMLALNAQRGDMCIRTDNGKTYVLSTDSPGTLADWKEVMATGQVVSVSGRTGVITLTKADVGLDQVDNTSDANKPISTATATALSGKAPTSHSHAIGDLPVATSGTSNTTQVVRADDARLSNNRVPTAHSHVEADLPSTLATDTEVATAVSNHAAAADPHPGYLTTAEGNAAYVPLSDARLTDQRTPLDNSVSSAKIVDGTIQAIDLAPGVIPPMSARVCDNGTSNPAGAAPSTVDGVALAVGNRVLRVGVGGAATNGLWVVQTVGTGANGTWVRALDADTSAEIAGQSVAVQEGTQYGGTRWRTPFKGTDTLGTTPMWWFYSSQDLAAVHNFGDESIAGVKTFTDPLAFEEETTSPAAPGSGARFFTRAGKMWVKTPSVEYALGVESAAVSLLTNGDFEVKKADPNPEPLGWNGYWHAGASTMVQATDDKVTGLASAKCHINAVADENINLQTDAAFPVTGGGVLNLEFNAKHGVTPGAKLDIVLQSSVDASNGAPNFFATGTFTTGTSQVFPVNGWTHYIRQFPVPAGHTLGRIAIRVMKDTTVANAQTTAQDVWIDTVVAQMDTSASATQTLEWRSAGISANVSFPGSKTIPFLMDYGGNGVTLNASGQMVIVTPGTYHAIASVEFTASAATYADFYIRHWRSGVQQSYRNTVQYGSGWFTAVAQSDFSCLAGDVLEVVMQPGAANVLVAEANRGQFTVHRLAGPGPIGPRGESGPADFAVRAVSTGNLTLPMSGLMTIDSVVLQAGDLVLQTGQTNAVYNGVWVVGTGNWVRYDKLDSSVELAACEVAVTEGLIYGGTRWQNSFKSTDTLNVTNMPWRLVGGDTGWIGFVYQNGWRDYGAPWETGQYRRLNGVVYIKGMLAGGTLGSAVITNLPAGFRCTGDKHVAVASGAAYGQINVFQDGRITCNAPLSASWLSLSNITPYPADF
jgi:hypothetical protein